MAAWLFPGQSFARQGFVKALAVVTRKQVFRPVSVQQALLKKAHKVRSVPANKSAKEEALESLILAQTPVCFL